MDDKLFNEIKKELSKRTKKVIQLDSSFRDLGIDSLALLDLVIDTEKYFNIKFNDSDLVKIKTVKNLIEQINKLKN